MQLRATHLRRRWDREPRVGVGEHELQLRGDEVGLEAEVEEAGAGDLGRLEALVHLQRGDDRARDVARLRLEPLAEPHRDVALVVAKLRLGRRRDERVGAGVLGAERLAERLADALGEPRLDVERGGGGCGLRRSCDRRDAAAQARRCLRFSQQRRGLVHGRAGCADKH